MIRLSAKLHVVDSNPLRQETLFLLTYDTKKLSKEDTVYLKRSRSPFIDADITDKLIKERLHE